MSFCVKKMPRSDEHDSIHHELKKVSLAFGFLWVAYFIRGLVAQPAIESKIRMVSSNQCSTLLAKLEKKKEETSNAK
jgi:hypothetical protein